MNRRRWFVVGVCVVLAFGGLTLATMKDLDANYNQKQTVRRARDVLESCETYREDAANPERGKFPTSLAELDKPKFAAAPFLRNGAEDLSDTWRNPFRYAVVTDANGEQEVYVWTERHVKGKLTLLGAKRKADGQIEHFGLDE